MNADQTLIELWALFELFRRLGFPSDDIYFVPEALDQSQTLVTVGMAIVQGDKRFIVTLDLCTETEETVRRWPAFAESINTKAQKELAMMWNSAVFGPKRAPDIIFAMQGKGFNPKPPKAPPLFSTNRGGAPTAKA